MRVMVVFNPFEKEKDDMEKEKAIESCETFEGRLNTISGKIVFAIVLKRNMQLMGKENSRKMKDFRWWVMMMMEVFVRSLEGGRVAGALPQSPDVQPSRRGTYMHVEQVRSYVWTYNRLVIHTHTHPGQCACGIGTNYVLTYNRLNTRTHC